MFPSPSDHLPWPCFAKKCVGALAGAGAGASRARLEGRGGGGAAQQAAGEELPPGSAMVYVSLGRGSAVLSTAQRGDQGDLLYSTSLRYRVGLLYRAHAVPAAEGVGDGEKEGFLSSSSK